MLMLIVINRAVIENMSGKKYAARKFKTKGLLREWYLLLTADERNAFLQIVGTSQAYIMQIYGGHSACSTEVARAIEEASDSVVPAWHLRPDLFQRPTKTKSI